MKKYFVLGAILLSFLVTLPAMAEEAGVSIDTNSDPVVVSDITITSSTTDIISGPVIIISETDSTTTTDNNSTTTIVIATDTTPTETTTTTFTFSTSSIVIVNEEATTTISTSTSDTSQTSSQINTATQTVLFTNGQIIQTANRINDYLRSQQSPDGKIQDGTGTDWAIMSFAATNQYAADIKKDGKSLLNYEEEYSLNDPKTINICAGYPRHILAFLAAGIDIDNVAIADLKNKILSTCYKDHLYGDYGINDDIFALMALLPTGSKINEEIIIDIINTIKADQTIDGAFTFAGWAGADMTGATINALKYAQNNGADIDPQIFARAKQYLKNNQLVDGGWGYGVSDVLTTSWAMMGINALGETQTDWTNSAGKNPWNVLIDNNKTDGSYESVWVPSTTDWFALQSAAPAILGKTWPIIMPAKVQEFHYTGGGYISALQNEVLNPTTTMDTVIPTTTLATTTIEIPTTTIPEIVLSTSTIITDINSSTEKLTPAKNKLTKKIIKNKLKKVKTNNVVNSVAAPTEPKIEDEKTSTFSKVMAASKKSLIDLGHKFLMLFRSVL